MFSDELPSCPGKSYCLQFCLQATGIIIDIKMTQEIQVLEHPHLYIPFWEESRKKYREEIKQTDLNNEKQF